MRTSAALAVLALAVTACSSSGTPSAQPSAAPAPAPAPSPAVAPAPAPASELAGTYDFSTAVQGQTIEGTVIITNVNGRLGGSILTPVTPELPIKSVTTKDSVVTITADTPDGELIIDMKPGVGGEFTGSWTYAGQGGTLRGRKRV